MAPPVPFKQVTRPDPPERIRRSALKTHNWSTGVHAALKSRDQVIFRDLSAARAKSLGGELSSGAPGVLLQRCEYAKVVLQRRHYHRKTAVLTS